MYRNKTHELMSVLSRIKYKIYKHKLIDIDYDKCIPDTLPLFSDNEDEIAATQLSYNLDEIIINR